MSEGCGPGDSEHMVNYNIVLGLPWYEKTAVKRKHMYTDSCGKDRQYKTMKITKPFITCQLRDQQVSTNYLISQLISDRQHGRLQMFSDKCKDKKPN